MKFLLVGAIMTLILTIVATGGVMCQANSTDQVQQKFQSVVGNWLIFFQDNIDWLSTTILMFVKNVIRAVYFTLGVVGFVMWTTGLSKYSGRRLLIGAVALALVSEILL